MNKKHIYLVVIFLMVASFIAYGRLFSNDFIHFDDNVYITENDHIQSGIHPESLQWAFTAFHSKNWLPLTWLSHMLDWSLFGANPVFHHLVNLLLHIGTVIFLFFFLNRTTTSPWISALATALFALHPLRVESVAWAAERKDVLSMFFGMAGIYVYSLYAESLRLSRYFLGLILFALSLLSKSMLVTLPFVLLLLDYWPLRRWPGQPSAAMKRERHGTGRLIGEKIPFVVLTVLASIITVWAQYEENVTRLPFTARMANAIHSYVVYLEKTFWPIDLAVFYPFEQVFSPWQISVFFLILTGLTVFVFYHMKSRPFIFVGWCWYVGTLVPVIGLVPVNVPMADHFTYFPSVGLAVMFSWGVWSFFKNERMTKSFLFPVGVAVLIVFSVLTWKQCGYWKNDLELFGHALSVTENNAMTHNNFGLALLTQGKDREAIDHFNRAIGITPDFVLPYYNRANAWMQLGSYEQAIADYNVAIRLQPDYAEGYYSRANAFGFLGQYRQAINDLDRAIMLKPDYVKAYNNRGILYGKLEQYNRAIENFNEIIRRRPGHASAYNNRGFAFLKLGRYQKALEDFSRAIALKSGYVKAYSNRADVYLKLGQPQKAIGDLRQVVRLQPDEKDARQLLNRILEGQLN